MNNDKQIGNQPYIICVGHNCTAYQLLEEALRTYLGCDVVGYVDDSDINNIGEKVPSKLHHPTHIIVFVEMTVPQDHYRTVYGRIRQHHPDVPIVWIVGDLNGPYTFIEGQANVTRFDTETAFDLDASDVPIFQRLKAHLGL